MVKIAQKLDFKKEYRLADKLTYIMKKKQNMALDILMKNLVK
jgi:hypothetical protein